MLLDEIGSIFDITRLTFRDGVGEIGEQRNVQLAEPSLLPGRVHPGQVSEVRVHRAGHNLGPDLAELRHPVVEGENLGGTDEREVQGVEEEDQVLPPVVLQGDLGELAVDHGSPGKLWCRLGDDSLGDLNTDWSTRGPGSE